MPASPSSPRSPSPPALGWVFLDRDGTLNAAAPPGDYIERPDDLELLPGAAEAVRLLNHAGIWTGLVTNQRGVALGIMSMDDVRAVNLRLTELLGLENAYLDDIYVCPHDIGVCDCRKPEPGMMLRAQRENPGLEFARAAMVGDSAGDVLAGQRLGMTTVLIAPGGQAPGEVIADHVVEGPLQAAAVVLRTARA